MLHAALLFGAYLLASPESPSTPLTSELGNFDDTYQFTEANGRFELFNNSDQALQIVVEAARPRDRVVQAPEVLAPHAAATVSVAVSTENEVGIHLHGFPVHIVGRDGVAVYGQVRGFVESALDQDRPYIDFGVVDASDDGRVESLALSSQDAAEFVIDGISAAPDFVSASVKADRRTLLVRLKKSNEWGIKDGVIKLSLRGVRQPESWVHVHADVHGDIVPFSNPFGFGIARLGAKNEYLIRFDDVRNREFRIARAELEGIKGAVSDQSCVPAKTGCRLLMLKVDDQQTGKLNGKIHLRFADSPNTLVVNVWGMLFSADAVIRDLEPSTSVASQAVTDSISTQLSKATSTTEVTSDPVPPGIGPLLRWRVENESQLYGYIVYRADSEGGPMERLNAKLIKTLSNEDGVAVDHLWRDTSAQAGHTYWYKIGTVSMLGVRSDLTPRMKKTVDDKLVPGNHAALLIPIPEHHALGGSSVEFEAMGRRPMRVTVDQAPHAV